MYNYLDITIHIMENIEQQIASLQSNYYSENKKNSFFKNSQKKI